MSFYCHCNQDLYGRASDVGLLGEHNDRALTWRDAEPGWYTRQAISDCPLVKSESLGDLDRLPREIMTRIYQLAFVHHGDIIDPTDRVIGAEPITKPKAVSKAFFRDSVDAYLQGNTFTLIQPDCLGDFFSYVGSHHASIRHLAFRIPTTLCGLGMSLTSALCLAARFEGLRLLRLTFHAPPNVPCTLGNPVGKYDGWEAVSEDESQEMDGNDAEIIALRIRDAHAMCKNLHFSTVSLRVLVYGLSKPSRITLGALLDAVTFPNLAVVYSET